MLKRGLDLGQLQGWVAQLVAQRAAPCVALQPFVALLTTRDSALLATERHRAYLADHKIPCDNAAGSASATGVRLGLQNRCNVARANVRRVRFPCASAMLTYIIKKHTLGASGLGTG